MSERVIFMSKICLSVRRYQNLYGDAMAYHRVIDGLLNKAQNLARSSADTRVIARMTRVNDTYLQLAKLSKVRVLHFIDVVLLTPYAPSEPFFIVLQATTAS